MPHTVHVSAIVHAPLEKVWACFRDFDGLARWQPGVAESRIEEGGRHDAVGSVRYLTGKSSGFVREKLLMLDDPGTTLRYAVIETSLPLRDGIAGVSLHPITESGHTLVQWWADFRVEGAPLSDVANAMQAMYATALAALDAKLREE
ncbi:polyketide cyclase/dehydrase family protein [Achromobacter xylosoxidans A8]|uniref:Polyketide cyclase/dehydrase family protein n=1 Tax=Achromobacter xylosoxidans (strain A8) TaxID=762376 RepID=E3HWW6_ACHXA|nr:SRPBCC family protein [Achromobacter xylosoxidans]ADP15157.1 polyketide cyclase/dehydrase family protein [Achromobacter xylosoxidans A8]